MGGSHTKAKRKERIESRGCSPTGLFLRVCMCSTDAITPGVYVPTICFLGLKARTSKTCGQKDAGRRFLLRQEREARDTVWLG